MRHKNGTTTKSGSKMLISGRENPSFSFFSIQFNTEININFISLIKVLYISLRLCRKIIANKKTLIFPIQLGKNVFWENGKK